MGGHLGVHLGCKFYASKPNHTFDRTCYFLDFCAFLITEYAKHEITFWGGSEITLPKSAIYLPCYLFSTSTQNSICASYFCYYNLAKRTWPTLLAFRQPNFTSLLSMRYSWNVFPSVRHMERKTMDNADTTEVILNLLSQNRHLSGTYEWNFEKIL